MLCLTISILWTCYIYEKEKMILNMNSLPQNPLQYAYFIFTKLKQWFGPVENNIFLVFEHFRNLNRCIFNKNILKWKVWIMCNVSWVISNIAVIRSWWQHKRKALYFFSNPLKEYEIIITVTYKIKKNMHVRFIMLLCTFCEI